LFSFQYLCSITSFSVTLPCICSAKLSCTGDFHYLRFHCPCVCISTVLV
jgi:hypothetical protein